MRTTVTLDDDVAAKLREEIARTGSSFKEALNRALRSSLNAPKKLAPRKRFKVRARGLGIKPAYNYDKVWKLIEEVEGPLAK